MTKRYLLYVACALVLIGLAGMLPVAAEDTGRIAFESTRDGNYEIYVMNADGTGQTRLTDNTALDRDPAFSPDGTKIAYVSNRDDLGATTPNKEIYVMNADGTGQTRLTWNAEYMVGDPAWCPDGTRIAYTMQSNVYLVNADGTNNVLLFEGFTGDGQPTWSPDGSKIAIKKYYTGLYSPLPSGWEISVMNADGADTRLTTFGVTCDDPAWSPDGARIAFALVNNQGKEIDTGIFVVDPDGSDLTRLTTISGGEPDEDPAWSPDSSRIAYMDHGGIGNEDIYVMNADGTGVTRLTTDAAYDAHPSWWGTADADTVPPTAAFTFSPAAPTTLDAVTFTDGSSDPDGTVVGWSWDFGDGDTSTEQNPEHSYETAGTYTVSLTVTDSDALTATVTHDVTVTSAPTPGNRAPIAVLNAYGMDEDTSLTVTADEGVLVNDVDADGDPLTAALVSGPAHGTVTLNADGSFTYTPAADFEGEDTFTYTANDGALDSNAATVTILVDAINDLPVAADDSYATDEDVPLAVAAPGILANDVDADGDPLTVSLVDDVAHGTLVLNADGSFTYTPSAEWSGTDTFTYRLNDGTVDSNTATVAIVVTPVNEPPSVSGVTVPTDPVAIRTAVAVTGTWTDPDPGDTHTAQWAWGDGTTGPGTVTEATGSVAGSHTYTKTGIYTVTLTVTDGDGETGTRASETYIVVYDPKAGYVTGNGWITSPAGAYRANLALAGQAAFGFYSQYAKKATTPSGQTEFLFQVADLHFYSNQYEWLVVAGARAQYKGTGTINGGGDYGFMLTAIDGQSSGGGGIDKFRIKIWDKATDAIVYDNQFGVADTGDPSTALGGGSIVIRKK